MRVLDSIFGGLSSSRLFQSVREERGLAYAVYSFAGQFTDTGQVGLYVGTRPDNLAEAMSVVDAELARLREQPGDARSELARARENVKARVVLALESSSARMNRLGGSTLYDLPLLEADEIMARSTRSDGRPARARRRAVGARAAVRRRHRTVRGRVLRRPSRRCARQPSPSPHDPRRRRRRRGAHGGGGLRGGRRRRRPRAHRPRRSGAGRGAGVGAGRLRRGRRLHAARHGARRTPGAALAAGRHVVVGTTGFDVEALRASAESASANAFVAPNFAIGAVLLMRFAAEASRHMQRAEIVEYHHPGKLDAPSGTAKRTAELMQGDVPIHSVRLPGLVADQDVILGDVAQTLTIRHVTTDRTSFMPGVLMAVRAVAGLPDRMTVGLERLLWPA